MWSPPIALPASPSPTTHYSLPPNTQGTPSSSLLFPIPFYPAPAGDKSLCTRTRRKPALELWRFFFLLSFFPSDEDKLLILTSPKYTPMLERSKPTDVSQVDLELSRLARCCSHPSSTPTLNHCFLSTNILFFFSFCNDSLLLYFLSSLRIVF